jgi:hypothetical protein
MSSNKILSILKQQIQDNNDLIKSYEKNLASVELKDGNIFLIYDDFSKINLGKFLDNDNSVYKEAKLVKKNYGHDLALTTEIDEVLVINNIEESFKLPKYNNVRVKKLGIQSAEVKNSHLYLYQEDGDKIDAGFVTGQKGEQGPRGKTGVQGNIGDEGPVGKKGESGKEGERGPKGVRGDVGSQGPEGPQGERGFKGMKGDRGEAGDRGERGINGPIGSNGDKGTKGEPGKDGDRGIKGSQGDIGEAGKKGQEGELGPVGPRGYKGERGAEGAQGLLGPRGLTGDQGSKGSKGSNGSIGEKGQKGGMGPEGERGAQGSQGTVGQQGQQGQIGPHGSKGEIGEAGSSGPKGTLGQKGEVGAPGTVGPDGQKGNKGDIGPQGIYGAYIDSRGYLQIVAGDNKSTESAGKVVPNKSLLHNNDISFDENILNTMEVEKSNILGRIVVANGFLNTEYDMNTIVPKCSFSTSRQQGNVLGIICSRSPNYVRNSGFGLVWIIDRSGSIKNGSLIQTSQYVGYGELQTDKIMSSYTIAKSMIDCEFNITSTAYKCIEITLNGGRVKCALLPCIIVCG